ncbi:MAG: hypothetical protein GY862_21225, partial [Gammaproteobacteria bacterium]|nr:hypothetical protein [Gammaproteobacteria bacterium]
EAALAQRKEITKTPAAEEKKDQMQNRTKTAGSVHEIQSEAAAPGKGRRRNDRRKGADTSQTQPQFQATDNVGYQQAIQSGSGGPLPP